MRSYKDSLLEYLEEQQFAALTKEWCTYLYRLLPQSTANFQSLLSYPPIQCDSDLEELYNQISSPNLADIYYFLSSNKISETSTKLISRIECVEDRLLKKYGIKDLSSWVDYKNAQKRKKEAFNYLESLENWMREQEGQAMELDLSEISKSRIDFINQYYRQRHLEKTQSSELKEELIEEEIQINFNSDSHPHQDELNWTDRVIEEGFPFFVSELDLYELNQKAKTAGLKIQGAIKAFRKLNVEPQNTSDLELFQAVLSDHRANVSDVFDHEELNDLKGLLNHTMQAFYCIGEFDVTVEIENDFSTADLELLRSIPFNCFPFYFSNKVEHYKWIELTEDGKLKIRLKSKNPQTVVIGAEIKKLKA